MIFKKKQIINDPKRNIRDLLRENINIIQVDMFSIDDPINKLTKEQRRIYLKSFFDLFKDAKLIDRIKYNINQQAIKTLGNAKDGVEDQAGAMNINGMAFVVDDIIRLANLYIKETSAPPEPEVDKFAIIPKVG